MKALCSGFTIVFTLAHIFLRAISVKWSALHARLIYWSKGWQGYTLMLLSCFTSVPLRATLCWPMMLAYERVPGVSEISANIETVSTVDGYWKYPPLNSSFILCPVITPPLLPCIQITIPIINLYQNSWHSNLEDKCCPKNKVFASISDFNCEMFNTSRQGEHLSVTEKFPPWTWKRTFQWQPSS